MNETQTLKERLLQEFSSAIYHTFGEDVNLPFDIDKVSASDIDYIAKKVKFYLGVD